MSQLSTDERVIWQEPGKSSNIFVEIWDQYGFAILLAVAFVVDLLTPYLIWKGYVPSVVRWLADAAILAALVLVFTRMMTLNHIPAAFLVIGAMSVTWATVAFFEGQGATVTVWGWWRMFKYPMVGLFAYLQPEWPSDMAAKIRNLVFLVLKVEIVWQLFQYVGGQPPGDHLAGSFGRNGVGPLTMFILFVLCVAMGEWLATGKTRMMVWTVVLGAVASGLAEVKMFPAALLALASLTLVIHMVRGGQFRKLIVYVAIFSVVVPVFISFYNVVVAEANGSRRFEEYFELETREAYLNNVYIAGDGRYYIGRGFALQLGWELIQRDATTFLFGFGLGTRSESVSLGLAGAGLQQGYYGTSTGTSLLVMMQELGVVGLSIFGIFLIWVSLRLFLDIRRNPQADDLNTLRYGLILYSLTWPLWIWYHQAWDFSVSMLLYWASLGIVMGISLKQKRSHFSQEIQANPS